MLPPTEQDLENTIDFQTYRRKDIFICMSRHVRKKKAKVSRPISASTKSRKLSPSHPISIIKPLENFTASSDTNWINKGVAVHQLQYSLNKKSSFTYKKRSAQWTMRVSRLCQFFVPRSDTISSKDLFHCMKNC